MKRCSQTEQNWANRTIWTGDNLHVMRGLNSDTVDLVYLDPPFNSKTNYAAPAGSVVSGAGFKDTWTLADINPEWVNLIERRHPALYRVLLAALNDSDKSYLTYMAVRLLEIHRVLKPTGSVYLHCDPTMSHYLKLCMDAIFGRDQFRNEIVWCYSSGGATRKRFSRKHDVLLLYGHSRDYVHNVIRVAYATPSVEGRPGFHPEGKMLQDWWSDIGIISTTGSERAGYPTQKPVKLLERIITATSDENDVIFDPFAGSGTCCAAAEKLNRQWLAIDLSAETADLVDKRVQTATANQVGQRFVTVRTDIAERSDLNNVTSRNPAVNRKLLYSEQGGCCAGCGDRSKPERFEMDRIICRSNGGSDHVENLQLLCRLCASTKHTRGVEYLRSKLQLDG